MSEDAWQRNADERERLVALVARLTKADLSRPVHDAWTVVAKLGHIAFWDRFALSVIERWASGSRFRIDIPDWYDDVLNDVVLVELLSMDPIIAAQLAVEAVSALDARVTEMGASERERLAADAERPETDANWLVHRYRHRGEHLDEIESALRS